MDSPTMFIVYAVGVILLAVYTGALTALEVLSLGRYDRGEGSSSADGRFTDRLLAEPVPYGIGLGLAQAAAVLVTVWSGVVVGNRALFPAAASRYELTAALVAVSLAVPLFLAKLIAVRGAERYLAGTRPIVQPTAVLLRPLGALVERVAERLSPALLRMLSFRVIALRDKIEAFGDQDGIIVDEEQLIMSSIAEFGETRVREVMVPRIDIVAVGVTTDKSEALDTIMEAGHSRIPVYEDTIDHIVGTLYTKDLLRKIVGGEEFSLRELAREAFFVPESKMIDDLLTEFKVRKQHLAIVVDEYGGTAGIITLEDVLEELVGDIQDEFDFEEELVRRIDEDTVQCNAKIRVDELNELLGLELPEEIAESLGGFLYHVIGHVPDVGDVHRVGGVEFEIESVERQRIDKVIIRGLRSLDRRLEDRAG